MSDLDSVVRYSDLLSIYHSLLSPTQKDVLEDYYLFNLSISEIAENRKISRSAVEDAIKKGKQKLDQYEKELCSLTALKKIQAIKTMTDDKKITSEIDEVERIIKHGI